VLVVRSPFDLAPLDARVLRRYHRAVRLPEPMLLRSGRLPASGDYAFESKWDGFRALVSRNGHVQVRSRRGWDMTSLVPELTGLPMAWGSMANSSRSVMTACRASRVSAIGCFTAGGASTSC
jgi:hypothetical protein